MVALELQAVVSAPFPWFGGKSTIADEVWRRFGDTPNYVEPFAGSAALLLARPDEHAWWSRIETINDADGFVANFWRAIQSDPEAVAHHADWPVNENDLHARHAWLVGERERLTARLEGDPAYCDARAAGWWVWGLCSWIGGGWCAGVGPWQVVDGELVKIASSKDGTNRKLSHLGNAGQGIHRQLPHLASAGQVAQWSEHLREMMAGLSDRLRRVRVCSGDWSRVCGPTPTITLGTTAVFLDPPYADTAGRKDGLYAVDSQSVAHAVREWALAHGDDPRYRIALCGYDGEHVMPESWSVLRWKAHGGYGSQGDNAGRANAKRETVWFSPHCVTQEMRQLTMVTP